MRAHTRRLRATLAEMHSYCRPHGSGAENAFRARYLAEFKPVRDPFGNLHVTVGPTSRILFSCHTDTVARHEGRQGVYIDAGQYLRLTERARLIQGACLGADDTVGVFLMREMILAGVPGHYVFHYGEEAGCLGSRSIAYHRPEFLEQFDAAIAFDRKDLGDVITHQCGSRTSSDAFALALADNLNATMPGFVYAPSDRGLYTDTNSYADIIPECTNLSIGYTSAHGSAEAVDVAHVLRLRRALLAVSWADLPIERDPADFAEDDWSQYEYYPTPTVRQTTPGPVVSSFPDRTSDRPRGVATPIWGNARNGWADDDEETIRPGRYPNDAPDLHDVIFLCEACGLEYFAAESWAKNKLAFCSSECEEFIGSRC